MKWKTLLLTVSISVAIFFLLVYLGMKFEWVKALQNKKTIKNEEVELAIPNKSLDQPIEKPALENEPDVAPQAVTNDGVGANDKNKFTPSLIGEETAVVDFTGMPLELVVEECRRISRKVGVPREQFNQSINECAVRNFQGRTSNDVTRSRNINAGFRQQCRKVIPVDQQELLSPEEMKLLVDECVADMHHKRSSGN